MVAWDFVECAALTSVWRRPVHPGTMKPITDARARLTQYGRTKNQPDGSPVVQSRAHVSPPKSENTPENPQSDHLPRLTLIRSVASSTEANPRYSTMLVV